MNHLTKLWYWLQGQYCILINPEHKIKTYYACGIAYQHEPDYTIYDSTKRLKKDHPSWQECGIVELKVVEHKWIEEQYLLTGLIVNKDD